MLIPVFKIVVVGICIGIIYPSCTGLYGVSFSLMTPESWVRLRKESM